MRRLGAEETGVHCFWNVGPGSLHAVARRAGRYDHPGVTSYLRAWRDIPARQRVLLLVLAGAIALANVSQPYPDEVPLQHVPTIVVAIAAPLLLARFPISTRALSALTGFFLLHTLAGRYTYSNVPYDAWARAITGGTISGLLGLKRNGFDRVVHLSFGLLWVAPVAEFARRHAGLGRRSSVWTAFLFIGAVSAAYEGFRVAADDRRRTGHGERL